MAKLLILDGFSLAFRAFYALPEGMVTSSGQHTNAIHGFVQMLLNLVKEQEPTHMAVAFDHPDPTFRDQLSVSYKGTRSKTPDPLVSQLPLIGQVVRSLGISLIEKAGFEADDVIATIATQAAQDQIDTIVVTGDRDSFQLVCDPYIKVLYNRRGVSDYELLDEKGVENRMGVEPALYPEFAALRGDPSDNIPGVPGIGQKTAAKLLNQYGSLQNIFLHLDELSPKLQTALQENKLQLELNQQLIPLVRDVPLSVQLSDLKLGQWDMDEAKELFQFLEFNKIWDRTKFVFADRIALGEPDDNVEARSGLMTLRKATVIKATDISDLAPFFDLLEGLPSIYIDADWSGTPGRSVIRTLSAGFLDRQDGVVVLVIAEDAINPSELLDGLLKGVSERNITVSGVDLKALLRYLITNSLTTFSIETDLSVASYLLDPGASDYGLSYLSQHWPGLIEFPSPSEGHPEQLMMSLGDVLDTEAVSARIQLGIEVEGRIKELLKEQGLIDLYLNVERPLISVLAKMEAVGILVDRTYLTALQGEFVAEAQRLQLEIQEMTGESFNVNSTQQLGKVLFEKMKLPPQKKTKTGYSTDARSLERLRDLHPVIPKILRYREVEKLRSTYGEGLLNEIAQDGRIHASFSQTVARTGRLSSDHPNLHNIPIRTADGRRFRNAFVASEGHVFVIADYSQIELRVIAHLCQDPGLLSAFQNGIDIHRQTASYTFGVPLDQVSSAQRNKAKMVAYGLAYGMEAYGLSQRLGVSIREAEEILGSFFAGFPKLKSYMESAVAQARRDGFTTTEFGRRRPLPELHSSNKQIRESAERQAMNAGIQGLAADIFKVALVRLEKELDPEKAHLVLQVHDEVLVETRLECLDEIKDKVKSILESAVELSVPLDVNVYVGHSWGDAKD